MDHIDPKFELDNHPQTILIVEDDVALALGRANCGELQLLLTDVVMPQMSGKRLADQLLVDCPGIRVMYISGYTDEAIAQYGVVKPDVSLIQKPFTSMSLAYKVREVLDL